ncbi:DNA repair protein RadA [Heyndrickxia coagulans]|uniref:DNA repair protein RadA n=1 Tax=Heyndrickxia coagulans TaxID=1398 RepID=UPI002E1B6D15|nr:DNA repair protein RadA [Heyndrickxia coagulans]MED4345088.1 DNA repair protein RadA [Heyndrickxia coagulans]
MAKKTVKFVCQNCGYESPKWMGKCPQCNQWNQMVEEAEAPKRRGFFLHPEPGNETKAAPITSIESKEEKRTKVDFGELNRVLGGGIVAGSLVLIGGDPGIGKSTLLLQVSSQLAKHGLNVLYISGEESAKQTKLRADRLNIHTDHLYVLPETDLSVIQQAIDELNPGFVVIDSIQTIYHPEIQSAPGSVSQVRETTAQLMRTAKTKNVAIFIVGHVTKEGSIAGPRVLEHMVDTVLYFEGERHNAYRILRAVKNRFGSTNEIAILEMKESGLEEVQNPSEIFLEERTKGAAGSTVVASIEGTRPVLVEIQALLAPTFFNMPRRMASGIDYNRVTLIMAVLEKRAGLLIQNQDAYLKVAGGLKVDEPAVDLAVAVSVASSFRDKPTNADDCIIGEVGLTGEVRRVSRIEQRVQEAAKLGFRRAIIPKNNMGGWTPPKEIQVIGVSTIQEALQAALGG